MALQAEVSNRSMTPSPSTSPMPVASNPKVSPGCAFQLFIPSLCRRSFSRVGVRKSDCCCEDQLSIIITLASQLEFAALDEVFRLPSYGRREARWNILGENVRELWKASRDTLNT